MKFEVSITTFERPEALRLLLLDLKREGARSVRVYDDCSTKADYAQCVELIKRCGWTWQRADKNYGRIDYPALLEWGWRDLAKSPSPDIYVFLEDDTRLCKNFFARLADTWQSIDSSSKGSLMLLTDMRDAIWGSTTQPRPLGKADQIGWVDTKYAAPASTLRDLQFKFPRVPPRPTGSSGAGIGLTKALRQLGRTMYRANPSLIAHASIPSVMHENEREKHPLNAKNFVDGEARHKQLLRGET